LTPAESHWQSGRASGSLSGSAHGEASNAAESQVLCTLEGEGVAEASVVNAVGADRVAILVDGADVTNSKLRLADARRRAAQGL
jgi:hypothetical protein